MTMTLPTGPRGRTLALGLTLVVVGAAWFGIAAPVLDWYQNRTETLRRQLALQQRMAVLVETLPALREAAETARSSHPTAALFSGGTDALAAAALQQKLDEMAAAAGLRIGSQEILPSQAADSLRAIPVRVTITSPWRALVNLLEATANAETPMMIDDLRLRALPGGAPTQDPLIDASFLVTAYRAVGAEAK